MTNVLSYLRGEWAPRTVSIILDWVAFPASLKSKMLKNKTYFCRRVYFSFFFFALPNQELSGAKSVLQGETVGVCSSYIREAANHPIIYLWSTFDLQEFFHRHVTSNNTTFGLPSDYRKISHLRTISIHTNLRKKSK